MIYLINSWWYFRLFSAQRLSGTSPKVPPARPTSTPSQPQQTNKKTASNSPLTTKSTSSSHSNASVNAGAVARDKNKTHSNSVSSINAGVVREKTGGAKGPSSKKDTLKAASLSIAEGRILSSGVLLEFLLKSLNLFSSLNLCVPFIFILFCKFFMNY